MDSPADRAVRALTNDNAFRVITARTTDTVAGAIAAQQGKGKTARLFGELLTGAVLYRETMAPSLRVQCIVRAGDGASMLVADSHPSGAARGLIQLAQGANEIQLDDRSLLQMMRTLHDGRIHQGVVRIPAREGISQALMVYMQESEQIVTMLQVGMLLEGPAIQAAGGYLVQLLPDAPRKSLSRMTERLQGFERIDAYLADPEFCADWLLAQLLHGIGYSRLEETSVRYDCWCDQVRVVSALASMSRQEIHELVASGKVVEMSCDYCGMNYSVTPAQLQGLLKRS